jgi:hypothetical protein
VVREHIADAWPRRWRWTHNGAQLCLALTPSVATACQLTEAGAEVSKRILPYGEVRLSHCENFGVPADALAFLKSMGALDDREYGRDDQEGGAP